MRCDLQPLRAQFNRDPFHARTVQVREMDRSASLRQQGRYNAPQTLRRTGDQCDLISKIRHRPTAAVYLIEIRDATIRQFASPFVGRAEMWNLAAMIGIRRDRQPIVKCDLMGI
jgi:hypothetical protein